MAEQDRKDLIPAVLNDLIDVDGTPADGDSLIRDGGVWVPTAPGGSAVDAHGPAITIWTGSVDVDFEQDGSQYIINGWAAMNAAMLFDQWNAFLQAQPTLGSWGSPNPDYVSVLAWQADTPGHYEINLKQNFIINHLPSDGANAQFCVPQSILMFLGYGADAPQVPVVTGDPSMVDHFSMVITQAMIDGGIGGFYVDGPNYYGDPDYKVSTIETVCRIVRHNPGNDVDYFDTVFD